MIARSKVIINAEARTIATMKDVPSTRRAMMDQYLIDYAYCDLTLNFYSELQYPGLLIS